MNKNVPLSVQGEGRDCSAQPAQILADGRWRGPHGIGRFATEVLARLTNTDILATGPAPLALKNLFWQSYLLARKQRYQVFFNPGFNPVLCSSIPYVFTMHDLIPLQVKNAKADRSKKLFFNLLIKSAANRAHKIITVSEYSKQTILAWTKLSAEKVVVAYGGSSAHFIPEGPRFTPGFPYLLHVGNNSKPHKNMLRLLQAFALATKGSNIKLLCTGQLSTEMHRLIEKLGLTAQVQAHINLTELQLAAYYRGAMGVVFPSLCEGFGLPVLEAMASGVPVLTANVASLPEVAGDAAILVDPYAVDAIVVGINALVSDTVLRAQLREKGLARAAVFSWDKTAEKVQGVLDAVC